MRIANTSKCYSRTVLKDCVCVPIQNYSGIFLLHLSENVTLKLCIKLFARVSVSKRFL